MSVDMWDKYVVSIIKGQMSARPSRFFCVKCLNGNITENIISFICPHQGRRLKYFSCNLIVKKALKALDDLLIK